MQRSLLLNALASMVVLAVAYPIIIVINIQYHVAVAKREDEARGVYFPISYDDDKKRCKTKLLGSTSRLATTTTRSAATEDEALGVYFPISYDDDKKRCNRGRGSWGLLPD
ncbi:hypothetical protein EV702DRAFT_1275094 [Suillus placidus]|uniref:Uncharacterized protein n=1 Tax=Suillus placidus TaxID=48579 RepID=A0A9P7A6W2_9AGAM|nr:hypothetical protein EV702DRAFT_1275094 [Suillus placidus]